MKILAAFIIMIFLLSSMSFSKMNVDKPDVYQMDFNGNSSFAMQPQNNIQNISSDEMAYKEYKRQEKNVWPGVLGAFFVPSLGHALVGDWGRGVPFLVADVIIYSSATSPVASSNVFGEIFARFFGGILLILISRTWEYVDVISYVYESNAKIKHKYGLDVNLRNNVPVLQHTLKF